MNWSNFIALLLAVSVIVLFSRSCKKDEEYASLQMKYEQAVKIKDSLGRTISVKDAEIVQNQESMKE